MAANDSLVNLVRKASPELAAAVMDLVVSISDTSVDINSNINSINRVWQALVAMDSSGADKPSKEQSGANVQSLDCRCNVAGATCRTEPQYG